MAKMKPPMAMVKGPKSAAAMGKQPAMKKAAVVGKGMAAPPFGKPAGAGAKAARKARVGKLML